MSAQSAHRQSGLILMSMDGQEPAAWRTCFEQLAPARRIVTERGNGHDDQIEYAVVWKQPTGLLSGLPNLKAVFSIGAGVDHVLIDDSLPDVPVVRVVAEDLTNRMSEYVVWQVLDQFRQGPAYRDLQRQAKWEWLPQTAARAVTVGIMGLGVLGLDAARKLSMMGFSIAGWSRTPKSVGGVATYDGGDGLDEFLGASDIVVVLLPLTPATTGILNYALFRKFRRPTVMPGGPVLINAGRGGLQVEADIVRALDEGLLGFASLDVFETEPLAADSPLWKHPKVTVTPHAGGNSDPDALVPLMIGQMDDHDSGLPLKNVVDRKAGY